MDRLRQRWSQSESFFVLCASHTSWCTLSTMRRCKWWCKRFASEYKWETSRSSHELRRSKDRRWWQRLPCQPVVRKRRRENMKNFKFVDRLNCFTMCQPKAAGSFSNDEYSLTVKVKLLNAMPRKNPAIQSQAIIDVSSVCSAKTEEQMNYNQLKHSKHPTKKLTWSCYCYKEDGNHEHQTFRNFCFIANRWYNNTCENVGEGRDTQAICSFLKSRV